MRRFDLTNVGDLLPEAIALVFLDGSWCLRKEHRERSLMVNSLKIP
jgi:hypothetical protein